MSLETEGAKYIFCFTYRVGPGAKRDSIKVGTRLPGEDIARKKLKRHFQAIRKPGERFYMVECVWSEQVMPEGNL